MVSKKTRSSAAVEDEKADVQEKMPPAEEPAAQESAREISATRRVEITETVLRDAHQSLMATRMSLDDMLPVLDQMDEIGYHSLEVWGGATFDACMRFLDEDPWERLRTLKKHFKKKIGRAHV